MKKNNLKRFLASLLAVLMLASVTGVSPAVFADWNSAATQSAENVAPVFQEYTGEVLIKSGWGNPEILDALATAFVQNKDSVDISAIEWTYKCAVKGTYKVAIDYTTKEAREAEVPVLTGKTVTEDYYYTRLLHAKATYVYPALKDVADGAYELYANGVLVGTIHKVGKLSSAINVNNEVATIAIPYTSGTEYDVNALNESIFNAYVTSTTPAGLTYDKFSYTGTVAEGQQTITISYAGDEDHYGTNAPVTVNFVDNRVEAFSAKEKPENISAGFVKNDANAELTVKNIREALVNQLSDLDLSEVSVGCKSSINALGGYDSLSDTGLKALLLTDTKADIKLTYAGSDTYKPFTAEFKGIKFADNRAASSIAVKEGASITFNMSADNMKQQIFDNVIDWDSENTKLPAKDTLSIDDFKFEIGLKDIAGDNDYPNLDAGNGQTIKISFVGNSEFKPCNDVEATIDVAKADVKVTMKSFSTAHAGNESELTRDKLNVKLDPNDSHIDTYLVFTGVNTDLQASVNLVLTDEQWKVIEKISNFQKGVFELAPDLFKDKATLKDKLESGITIKEFKEYLNSFVNALEKATKVPIIGDGINDLITKYGISIETLKAMATIFDNLTKISDNTKIAMGAPEHAGIYQVWAIAINKNYNTGVASGTVMILMNVKDMKIQLNSNFSKKMTVAQAKALAEDPAGVATLLCGTKPVGNPNLHYLYTGVQSNLKPYSSTTDFPTAPGRYVVTIVTLGGDYLAPPVTKTFQITK